jgi:phospho-N-acetylmuramoyl-pentapeptide-transferase
MLYSVVQWLQADYPGLHVFDFVMVRAVAAILTSLLVTFLIAPSMIARMRASQFSQPIREGIALSHKHKEGTPTMGGILILVSVTFSVLLWGDLHHQSLWVALFVMLSFGGVGALDDFLKLRGRNTKGLSARWKYLLQSLLAGLAVGFLYLHGYGDQSRLVVPFFAEVMPMLGVWFIPLAYFVIVGSSNAVNLTDGLDGLAIMPAVLVSLALGILSYVVGDVSLANAHLLPHAAVSELMVFCAALVGSGLGFLWYNAYPAEVFMGDIGALGVGAALGVVAVLIHQEILLFLMGGVFVAETISVILQVASFRLTGKRIFRMAPLHHHFELKGWPEPQIIVRFWVITFVLVLVGLISLKFR